MLLTIEFFIFVAIFFLAYGLTIGLNSRAKVQMRASDLGAMTLDRRARNQRCPASRRPR